MPSLAVCRIVVRKQAPASACRIAQADRPVSRPQKEHEPIHTATLPGEHGSEITRIRDGASGAIGPA